MRGLARARRLATVLAPRVRGGRIAVSYGVERLPSRDEVVGGGIVKFQRMQTAFPNRPRRFNVLYLGSSTMPPDWREQVALARRRGARFAWNQNGVAYPAWAGSEFEQVNGPMAEALHAADHVFFQSHFCKLSADSFLGRRDGPWEILYNAVDTGVFVPERRESDGLTLLLGGDQFQRYRFEAAARMLALVARERSDVRLVVTGRLRWTPDADRDGRAILVSLGVEDRVDFLGAYTQAEAPTVLRRGDILVHPKVNDPCPSIVIEAMACGLPVVHAASGGVPELVGDEAGVGVESDTSWDRDVPPAPEALAAAVLLVAEERSERAEAARARAVERFDLRAWLQRHREVFGELVRES